jgi:hypothetical protein
MPVAASSKPARTLPGWRAAPATRLGGGGAILAALAAACATSVGPLNSNVQVSFATRGPATATAGSPVAGAAALGQIALADTITDGTHTLILTRAQVVLGDIRLERQGGNCTLGTTGCEDVSLPPALVDLPLVPGAQPQFSVQLPLGTYEQIAFQVHKVTSQDPADLQPLLGKSIHVEGTYDGTPVTFDTDMDAGQEIELSPALVVTDTTALANVTVKILVGQWFLAPDSTVLNPQTGNAGGPNESLILENIKQSMQAFEDDNRTGEPDR